MFGIFHKKGGFAGKNTISAVKTFFQKKQNGWALTPQGEVKYISKIQEPINKLLLIAFEEPLLKEPALLHDGKIYSDTSMIESRLKNQDDLTAGFTNILQALDGEFALALSNGKEINVARDILGRKPIFYDENSEIAAFCSQKKPLWQIGLHNVRPLRAGEYLYITEKGIDVHKTSSLKKSIGQPENNNLDNIIEEYGKMLQNAITKRLDKTKKIGALLSGGVDSTLLAKLVNENTEKDYGKITIYTAGTPGATDVGYAKRFAEQYGFNHKVRKLELTDIESYIPKVIKTVEERDFVQVEAGIGVYAALEMAAQDGVEVIFSGQGPDELWGGYEWYPDVIAREGYEGFLVRSWSDLERADIETLDRENKIAASHGILSVFPYIDTEIVKLAMNVSPELKINSESDRLGKRPHRALAAKLGLPSEFADRKKDAAQHGTGIHDMLDEIAQKNGYNPDMMAKLNYRGSEISDEILSSSARYGYLYADKNAWQIGDHIQYLFDTIAFREGLLNEAERSKIESYIKSSQ